MARRTARKLLWPLLRSPQPVRVKIAGALHLTAYLVHPLVLAAMLLALPMSFSRSPVLHWVPLLMFAALGPPLLYLTAAAPNGPNGRGRLKLLPGLVLLGIGLSFNNSRAALAGLFFAGRGAFRRTPKFAVRRSEERWERSSYALKQDPWVWAEILLGWFAGACVLRLHPAEASVYWGSVLWLIIYAASFGYVVTVTVLQTARRYVWAKAQPESATHTEADIPSVG